MDYVFILCLSLGFYVIFYLSRQKIKVEQVRKKSSTNTVNESDSIDVRLVIINNSVMLSWLYAVDLSMRKKFKFVCFLSVIMYVAILITSSSTGFYIFMKICLLNFMLVTIMPLILIPPIVSSEMKKIKNAVPFFIDLVAVCVQTGLTVENSILFISEKFGRFNVNMASLMAIVIQKSTIIGFEDAINRLYISATITELKIFCSCLQQSVHYGTPLYENLMELSKDMRTNMILETEEKVGKLSAKMSVPLILLIMFPITILIIAPGLLRILKSAGL